MRIIHEKCLPSLDRTSNLCTASLLHAPLQHQKACDAIKNGFDACDVSPNMQKKATELSRS